MASLTSLTPPQKRVDVWELRCRFNRARYYERSQAGEFTVVEGKKNPIPPERNLPRDYAYTQECYYRDMQTGTQLARIHQYWRTDGTLGGSGRPDPKDLYVGGTRYRLHRGWNGQKDPSIRFPEGPARRAYLLWRRFKCLLLGR